MIIGAAVRHDQDFRAGLGQAFGNLGEPHILADHDPEPNPLERDGTGKRPGLENTVLIEDAIVRQLVLEAAGSDLSPLQQADRVIELPLLDHRRAHQHGGPAVEGQLGEVLHRFLGGALKGGFTDQILGRIAAQEQFRINDYIRPERLRLLAEGAGERDIGLKAAECRVGLGQRNFQLVCHEGFLTRLDARRNRQIGFWPEIFQKFRKSGVIRPQ